MAGVGSSPVAGLSRRHVAIQPRCCAELLNNRLLQQSHPTALPGGRENLGDGRLQAFMGVGDDELHAAQAATGELDTRINLAR